jgi:hypothetical protein
MQKRVVVFCASLLLLAGVAITSAVRAADSPNAGTWKLNLEKSKYDPGPAPKSATVTIKIDNNTETYSSDTVTATGEAVHGSFTAKLDGTDAPVAGIPYADMISATLMSPTHIVAKLKKGGKVMMTVHVVVAADGMSRTVTYSGTNEKGQAVKDKLVYDKQM